MWLYIVAKNNPRDKLTLLHSTGFEMYTHKVDLRFNRADRRVISRIRTMRAFCHNIPNFHMLAC